MGTLYKFIISRYQLLDNYYDVQKIHLVETIVHFLENAFSSRPIEQIKN